MPDLSDLSVVFSLCQAYGGVVTAGLLILLAGWKVAGFGARGLWGAGRLALAGVRRCLPSPKPLSDLAQAILEAVRSYNATVTADSVCCGLWTVRPEADVCFIAYGKSEKNEDVGALLAAHERDLLRKEARGIIAAVKAADLGQRKAALAESARLAARK